MFIPVACVEHRDTRIRHRRTTRISDGAADLAVACGNLSDGGRCNHTGKQKKA